MSQPNTNTGYPDGLLHRLRRRRYMNYPDPLCQLAADEIVRLRKEVADRDTRIRRMEREFKKERAQATRAIHRAANRLGGVEDER